MGKEFCPKNGKKVPFLRGKNDLVFQRFHSKFSKRELIPFFSEEMGIISERMGITSEEIRINGEGMCISSERMCIIGEGIAIIGEGMRGIKKVTYPHGRVAQEFAILSCICMESSVRMYGIRRACRV